MTHNEAGDPSKSYNFLQDEVAPDYKPSIPFQQSGIALPPSETIDASAKSQLEILKPLDSSQIANLSFPEFKQYSSWRENERLNQLEDKNPSYSPDKYDLFDNSIKVSNYCRYEGFGNIGSDGEVKEEVKRKKVAGGKEIPIRCDPGEK